MFFEGVAYQNRKVSGRENLWEPDMAYPDLYHGDSE